jgi:transcriptional regulator with XRE-family HTH domain
MENVGMARQWLCLSITLLCVRTWKQVGQLLAERREALGLTQAEASQLANISEASWNVLENGRAERFRRSTLRGAAVALKWPLDAIDRLIAGEDPARFVHTVHTNAVIPIAVVPQAGEVGRSDGEIQLDASGVDLEELRLTDPDGYARVVEMARLLLDRARERRGG